MTGIEDVLRAELAREATSLDFMPREEAWAAIERRAAAGAGTRVRPEIAVIRRSATTEHTDVEPARQRRRGWLMVVGSVAAVVATVLAGMYLGGVYGPSGHRPAPGPGPVPPSPILGTNRPGPLFNGSPDINGFPNLANLLPSGVIRVAPPPGQPGVTMFAWSVTYKVLANPADLKPRMTKEQIAKLPTQTMTDLCMSDLPPAQAPRDNAGPDCPVLAYLGVAVNHTPRVGFPVSGGDTWIGTATANVGSVEARYADGRVVRGFIATIPGSNVRVWALGLAGPPLTGTVAGVSLILRDTHGTFLGKGSLSANLPSPFPFQLHAPQGAMLRLFPGQDVPEVAIAAWGGYAVFGWPDGSTVIPEGTAYPLPARLPLQGEFEMDAGYLHPWWFGLARADVAKVIVRLADGRTMQATCPSPAPAPVSPSKLPRDGGSLASKHLVSTCAAIPGAPGGERAFAIQLPQEFYRETNPAALPRGTATAYDSAGQALVTTPLGTAFTH